MQLDGPVGLLLSVVTNWNSHFSTAQYSGNYVCTQHMGMNLNYV